MPTKPNNIKLPWKTTAPRGEHGGRRFYDQRYNTRRWKKVRAMQLMQHPWCVECLRKIPPVYTQATVVDHIKQVSAGGDFFDSRNHQSMCKPCHDSKSGKEGHK